MVPTKEQEKIFHYVKTRPENILIEAYAGSGKTTTIVEASKLIDKSKSVIFVAFNKHIQEELKTKLPEHVRCSTTYALGYGAIKRKYPNIKFDEFKIDKIIKTKSKSWDLDKEINNYEEVQFYLGLIKKLVNLCRLTLTLNKEYIPYISDRYEIGLNKTEDIKRVLKVLDTASNDRESMDFTDMVFLPAIDKSIWMFQYDVVISDEIQDFNRAQIKIIEKILKRDRKTGKVLGRLISVGDFYQSIYGFNGSDDKSFNWFRNFENTKVLPLSYSFRCGKNIIERAKEIVPNIKALDNAIDGIVRNGSVVTEAQSGDLVLCRTTVPLVRLFFQFLLEKKKVFIKGADIGDNLIELIYDNKTIKELISFWETELEFKRIKLREMGVINPNEDTSYTNLEDKVSALLFLGRLSKDIDDLKNSIKNIFTDDTRDGIILSTVHKSKGCESERVFIIRKDILPMQVKGWQYMQELNLLYIAYTRAKKELIIDLEWTDEEINDNENNK